MVQGEIRCPCRHSRSTALPSAHTAIIPVPQTNDNLLLCHWTPHPAPSVGDAARPWTRLYSQAISPTEVIISDRALARPGAPKRPCAEVRGSGPPPNCRHRGSCGRAWTALAADKCPRLTTSAEVGGPFRDLDLRDGATTAGTRLPFSVVH